MTLVARMALAALAALILVALAARAADAAGAHGAGATPLVVAQSVVAQSTAPAQPMEQRGLNALRPSAKAAGPSGAPAAAAPAGWLDRTWAWVMQTQQQLNRDLVAAVKGLKTDPVGAALLLGWLSFAYGVLHAAGPGHGKAVISAYVLANERTVRRGILLSFLAAFFQALSALLIVGILSVALKATSLTLRSAEAWIETISWALVAGVGAWLLYSQSKPLLARAVARSGAEARPHGQAHHGHAQHGDCCGHDHGHAHTHTHGHGHAHGHSLTAHGHDHAHDHADCCGHAHMPSPKDLEGAWSWRKAFAIAFSVGIRPCTGAILVLLFALSQGLVWAGVFATFAMAIGTAITVSALAAMAVGSKELALRYAGGDGKWASRIATAAGVVGGFLVLAMGTTGFIASLKGPGAF